MKHNTKQTELPAHATCILAQRFFIHDTIKCEVSQDELIIPHKIVSNNNAINNQGLFLQLGLLYKALSTVIHYKIPALDVITKMKKPRDYKIVVESPQGHELAIKALKITCDNDNKPEEGYYQITSIDAKSNAYTYSDGQDLYLTRHLKLTSKRINDQFDSPYKFRYVLKTPHRLVLSPGYKINTANGFFKKGLYHKDNDFWFRVDKDFDKIDGEASIEIRYLNKNSFIEDVVFNKRESNIEILQTLANFHDLQNVKKLNFTDFSFNTDEQKQLIALLPNIPYIESLNLSKQDDGTDYNTLVPTLLQTATLKHLNLIGCRISEANLKQLASRSQLNLVPKPVVEEVKTVVKALIPVLPPAPQPVYVAPPPQPPHVVQIITERVAGKDFYNDINGYQFGEIIYTRNVLYYSNGKKSAEKWREEHKKIDSFSNYDKPSMSGSWVVHNPFDNSNRAFFYNKYKSQVSSVSKPKD